MPVTDRHFLAFSDQEAQDGCARFLETKNDAKTQRIRVNQTRTCFLLIANRKDVHYGSV